MKITKNEFENIINEVLQDKETYVYLDILQCLESNWIWCAEQYEKKRMFRLSEEFYEKAEIITLFLDKKRQEY